jgi:acetyltransferase
VSIRPIEATDAGDLSAFYAGLSPESRHRRFLGATFGITPEQAARFASVDHGTAVGMLAVLGEAGPDDGRIVGHVCVEPSPDGTGEVAIAVADELQGRGIGRELMRQAVIAAHHRRLRALTASLFSDNVGMRRLLSGSGLPIRPRGSQGGVSEVELDLDRT